MAADSTGAEPTGPVTEPVALEPSSQTADAMQHFIQHYLLSLLQPVSEHVSDLWRQVNALEHETRSNDAALKAYDNRLEIYEAQLKTLGIDVAQSKTKITLAQSTTDVLCKRVGQGAEDIAKLTTRMHQGESKTQEIDARLKQAHQDNENCQAQIQQLQLDTRKAAVAVEKLSTDAGNLQDTVQKLSSESLAQASQFKQHVDKAEADLRELAAVNDRRHADFRSSTAQLSSRTDSLDKLAAAIKTDMSNIEGRFSARIDDIVTEMQKIREMIEEEKRINDEQAAQMNSMATEQGMDHAHSPQQAIIKCCRRLDAHDEELLKLDKLVGETKETATTGIIDNQKKIAVNLGRLDSLNKAQQNFEAHLSRTTRRLDAQDPKIEQLKDQTETVDANLRTAVMTQREAIDKFDAQFREFGKTARRVEDLERKLDDAGTKMSNLHSEVSKTNEGMSKTALRIDLAHDYLHGLGKGIQDAHKRVLNGLDGTLPYRETVRTPRVLPTLPTRPMATDLITGTLPTK